MSFKLTPSDIARLEAEYLRRLFAKDKEIQDKLDEVVQDMNQTMQDKEARAAAVDTETAERFLEAHDEKNWRSQF